MSRSNTNLHQGPTDSMVMVRHQTLHVLQGINKMTSPSVRKESRDLPCPNCGSGQRMQPKIRCCAGSAGPFPGSHLAIQACFIHLTNVKIGP